MTSPETETPPQRIAILSLLFNWPSTGGGTVHTAELGKFLAAAGFEVRHFFAQFEEWAIGNVSNPLLPETEAIRFSAKEWNVHGIQSRFRAVLRDFQPDWVIITDSWNSKPILAQAAEGFRFLLRIAAQECLCPLNNVRLLLDHGRFRSCPKHQLATPGDCCQCVRQNGKTSGELHRAERELVGYGSREYDDALRWAIQHAEAVLVVNPLIEAMVSPYAKKVCVIPSGFDASRFPTDTLFPPMAGRSRIKVLFAGLVHEPMKGFEVIHEACAQLWQQRQDFELIVTSDPPNRTDPFIRFVGWQSQQALPAVIRDADVVVVPTIAEEALGRTAVEAMAAARPVVASRIGGLQFTVIDGATGLLFEPGNVADLRRKLELLLDDQSERRRLGAAGRRRFEQHYEWQVVIDKFYRPLLRSPADPNAIPATAPAGAIGSNSTTPPSGDSIKLGCVLSIRDRNPQILERTFQTYQWQSLQADDQVLLDYGSSHSFSTAYAMLSAKYGWRYIRWEPSEPRWQAAAAHNLAVSFLRGDIDTVFKNDVDVLLGPEVLAVAAERGRDGFCQFQYVTIPESTTMPESLCESSQLRELFLSTGKNRASCGTGLFACPRKWFEAIGGFDLAYREWGYEDDDLRVRAEQSIPVIEISFEEVLLLHQWHPINVLDGHVDVNCDYFERMSASGAVVRNGGMLILGNR